MELILRLSEDEDAPAPRRYPAQLFEVYFPSGGVDIRRIATRRGNGVSAMVPVSPPVEIVSPFVRELFAYWQRRSAGRLAPRPRDIEPGDIKRLLPYICISDVIAEPFDLRYRLGGTAVVETSGYDFTGQFLHEMPVTTGMEHWKKHYIRVVNEKRPFYGRYRGNLGPDLARHVAHGAFPLSSDGVVVDRIIEIEDWSEIRGVVLTGLDLPIWQFEPLPGRRIAEKLSPDIDATLARRPGESSA